MTTCKEFPPAAARVCVGLLALLSGCQGRPAELTAAPQTQPASPAEEDLPPLPAKALVPFEQLQPPIARPVNPPAGDPLPPRTQQDLVEAEKLLAAKKYAAAVDVLERAAGFAPTHARIRRLLGQAYLHLPNRGKAVANLTEAVKAEPDDLETQFLLGRLAASQDQNEPAIVHLRTALKCSQALPEDPRTAEVLLTVSLLLDSQGYWTAAGEGYALLAERIRRHGGEYASRPALREWVLRPERLLVRQGSALLMLRKYEQAAQLLESAYRRDRANAGAARLLIEALLGARRHEQAEGLLVDMAAQPSQQANLRGLLADLCGATADRALPQRFWKALQAGHHADANLAIALAKIAQDRGWGQEALEILQSVASAKPNDPDLWQILCRSYAERGDYEKLLASMEQSLRGEPGCLEAIAAAMDDLAAAAKDPDVERRFAELARKSPSPVRHALLYLAGRLASAKRRHILAADLFQRATEQKKDFFAAYEALLGAYLDQDRDDLVDRLLDRLARLAENTHLPAYYRGKVALRRGNPDAAVTALQEALRLKDADLPTLLLLAEAYRAAGKTRDAARTLQQVLDAHPGHLDAAGRLFELYLARGQVTEARAVAARLLREDRDSLPGQLMLAELALAAGRDSEAAALLARLSQRAPENADVQYLFVRALLGRVPGLIRKQAFDDAVERLRRILRVQPGSRPARKGLAELLDAVGNTAEAAAMWAPLFEEAPGEAELAQRYVGALARTKQHAAALQAIERHRQKEPDDLRMRLLHLEMLGELKRFDEALRLGEEWLRGAADENVEALLRQELLRITEAGKQHDKALKVVADWIAKGVAEQRLRLLEYTRLRLLGSLGRHDEARKLVDRLRRADPQSQPLRMLVAVAVEAKQYDRALQLLDDAVAQERELTDALRALSKAVETLAQKKAKTDEPYEQAVAKAPDELRSALAAALDAQRYDQAQRLLERWRESADENHGRVRALRIIVYGEAKQLGRARHLAEEWIKQSPQAPEPRKALVGLLAEADAYDEADALVARWLKDLAPTTAPARPQDLGETVLWLMGTSIRLKLSRDRPAEALQLAERHLRLAPKDSDLLSLQSAALGELGQDDKALAAMEAATALKPDDASLNNNLGYIYAERGVQLQKAEQLLRKALTGRPEEIAFQDSLAWIFYKQGRFQEAGRLFQRLLADEGNQEIEHGVIFDHAGDAYYRLGWKDRAVTFWKRAVELSGKVKRPSREDKQVLSQTTAKIEAVRKAREPKLAPLGEPVPRAPATRPARR